MSKSRTISLRWFSNCSTYMMATSCRKIASSTEQTMGHNSLCEVHIGQTELKENSTFLSYPDQEI